MSAGGAELRKPQMIPATSTPGGGQGRRRRGDKAASDPAATPHPSFRILSCGPRSPELVSPSLLVLEHPPTSVQGRAELGREVFPASCLPEHWGEECKVPGDICHPLPTTSY